MWVRSSRCGKARPPFRLPEALVKNLLKHLETCHLTLAAHGITDMNIPETQSSAGHGEE